MKKISIVAAVFLCLCPLPGRAYDTEMDSRAIHEAYVLGRRNDKSTGDFLNSYIAQMTESQNGAHIAEIELLTPYAQIVDQSRQKADAGYSEPQAAEEYRKHPGVLRLNVTIMLPAAYPKPGDSAAPATPPASGPQKSALQPENFWQNFQFHLKQGTKSIPSKSLSNQPIHSSASNDAPAVLDGENVWLEFDVHDVASVDTIVEVVTPEGQVIKTNFDLKKLR
jgi:hypothetical protein